MPSSLQNELSTQLWKIKTQSCVCVCVTLFYLFAGDVLKVLACHDASEFGFNKALCPFSLWRPAKDEASLKFQHWHSNSCSDISTTGVACIINVDISTRNPIQAVLCLLTWRRTWEASLAVWSPSLSLRSTHWCSSGLKRCSSHSSPSRWEPCRQGSSYTFGTPRIPCAAPAVLTYMIVWKDMGHNCKFLI